MSRGWYQRERIQERRSFRETVMKENECQKTLEMYEMLRLYPGDAENE